MPTNHPEHHNTYFKLMELMLAWWPLQHDSSVSVPITSKRKGSVEERLPKIAEHLTFLRTIKNPVDH